MVSLLTVLRGSRIVARFVKNVFPVVDTELARWKSVAANAAPELMGQALASIRDKRFHCQGGSVYSLYPGVNTTEFIRFVVAYQTISDYLDNLCDRAGIADEQAFRQLHLAMTESLDPESSLSDYYKYYPLKEDGGYLESLVKTCREEVARLKSFSAVKPHVIHLATLYSELQTYKHLDNSVREQKMASWGDVHLAGIPGISLWEFAAATGSTLGIFMLCATAAHPNLQPRAVRDTLSAYFPWICGLHILLDYFIDRVEDRCHGDLNFVAYYKDDDEVATRLIYFYRQAVICARTLPNPAFNETVVSGLIAMYLSDPKTTHPPEASIKKNILATVGFYTKIIYTICRLLRQKDLL